MCFHQTRAEEEVLKRGEQCVCVCVCIGLPQLQVAVGLGTFNNPPSTAVRQPQENYSQGTTIYMLPEFPDLGDVCVRVISGS